MSSPEAVLDRWPVDKLRKHRLQDQYFGKRSDEELLELAEVIRRSSMHPIDVKPDGTVLSGHQRWHIARYVFRWEDVPVNVRHDLVAKGEEACDQYFLHANKINREPSMLQKARAFVLDCELEEKRRMKDKSLGKRERLGRVRDAVAKRFGKSGRTLVDWLPILKAPKEVQAAVEDKRLTRAQAMQILAAPKNLQAKIASQLAEHKTVEKVLKLLGKPKREPPSKTKLTRTWRELIRKARDLYHHRPECFAAVLPEQRRGVEFAIEFAELTKAHFAAAKGDADVNKMPKLKLVLKTTKASGVPAGPPALPSKEPECMLKRKDDVA